MKKFFVCAAVFAAIFLIIGCGDSGSSGDGDGVEKFEGEKCDMVEGQDIFICEGSVVLKCVEEKWTKQEECLEGQTCNAQTGKCDGGENNDDNNNNNNGEEQPATKCGNRVTDEGEVCDGGAVECKTLDASQTGYAYCKQDCSGYDTSTCTAGGNNGGGDNGGGNGGGTTTGSCSEIFQCMSQATDAAGQQACIQSGNQDGQSQIMALIQCVQNNGCQYINQCDPCTNEYNTCVSGNGGNGGGNGGGTTTGSCSEIFQCMSQATDAAGQQACIQSGNQDGQSLIMALIQCVQNNGCQYINQCDPCTNEYNSCMSN